MTLTKPNTFRHNQPASVASLRQLFAFSGTQFGFPLESPFTFTGIPSSGVLPELRSCSTLCGPSLRTGLDHGVLPCVRQATRNLPGRQEPLRRRAWRLLTYVRLLSRMLRASQSGGSWAIPALKEWATARPREHGRRSCTAAGAKSKVTIMPVINNWTAWRHFKAQKTRVVRVSTSLHAATEARQIRQRNEHGLPLFWS